MLTDPGSVGDLGPDGLQTNEQATKYQARLSQFTAAADKAEKQRKKITWKEEYDPNKDVVKACDAG